MVATPLEWKPLDLARSQSRLPTGSQVAALGDGGYVVVWTDQSDEHNPDGSAIVAQRFNARGERVGGEVKISQFNNGSQDSPAIVAMPDGGVAIAFHDVAGQAPNDMHDIYVRRYDANLNLVGTHAIENTPAQSRNPAITAFADNSYLVTYTARPVDSSRLDVLGRTVSASGTMSAPFQIDLVGQNSDASKVARLSNGNFVVVYQQTLTDGLPRAELQLRILTPTGAQVLGPTPIPGAVGFIGEPDLQDVAALRGGGFVVVWADRISAEIEATIFNNAGQVLLSNLTVNAPSFEAERVPSVAALADGGFLVTWSDGVDILGQRFDAVGNRVGAEHFVARGWVLPGDSRTFLGSDAAPLRDGRIAVATDLSTGFEDPHNPGVVFLNEEVLGGVFDARNVAVSADFNRDLAGDVLWRHSDGTLVAWTVNAAGGFGTKALGAPEGAWRIAETGDFNRDGFGDILWRHADGTVVSWLMNASGIAATRNLGAPEAAWRLAESADFNGDGRSDLLWRHTDGTVIAWLLNETASTTSAALGNPGSAWHIAGAADFNADGVSDILWRHDTGAVALWLVKAGGGITAPPNLGRPDPTWRIEGTGDFNTDQRGDILWRNTITGEVVLWELNAAGSFSSRPLGGPENSWRIEDVTDTNADGRSDLLWRNTASGEVVAWQLTASGFTNRPLGGPDNNWQIFSDPTELV